MSWDYDFAYVKQLADAACRFSDFGKDTSDCDSVAGSDDYLPVIVDRPEGLNLGDPTNWVANVQTSARVLRDPNALPAVDQSSIRSPGHGNQRRPIVDFEWPSAADRHQCQGEYCDC